MADYRCRAVHALSPSLLQLSSLQLRWLVERVGEEWREDGGAVWLRRWWKVMSVSDDGW